MAFQLPLHHLGKPQLTFYRFRPYDLQLMLHFHCSQARWPEADAPAFPDAVRCLHDAGVLEESINGLDWCLSELGTAWLRAMLLTPQPRKAWIDANGQELEP